jgi:DegV family protein with EDD domain
LQLSDEHVEVFDTLNVAAGEALQTMEAARLAQAGKSLGEIIQRLEAMRNHVHLYFVLDTLEYLAKGGRVGNAQAFIGSLLQMKPILEIRNGLVEGADRVRTRSKARARLRGIVAEAMRGKSRAQMGVMHTGIREVAEDLANELISQYHLDDCLIHPVSPAVAAHAGPGALGVAFYIEG